MTTLLFAILLVRSAHATTNICATLLSGFNKQLEPADPSPVIDGTAGFIAYMGQLLEQQLIGQSELNVLIDGIESRSEIPNPIPHEVTAYGVLFTKSSYQIHYEELEEYIRHSRLDEKKILAWALTASKEKERVRERREETRQGTQHVHQEIEFHRVEKGDFQMDKGCDNVKVTLTHPFEVMSTLVTQKMWVDAMGENPSKFQDGEQTVVVSKNGKQIKMQPDNPVEQITWWSAIMFANKLSLKTGLKPAYDVSNVKFKQGTSAENGTLEAESGDVKINAPNGDIYRAEGFRLPTEAEQEYLLTDRGRSSTEYFSDVDENNLKDHAWHFDNSDERTHPVAQLAPQVIDGKEFYDLHGNVWEWGNDWYDSFPLKGGTDPKGPSMGWSRVKRGGGWCNIAGIINSTYRGHDGPGGCLSSIGFRLVRTVK